MSDHVLAYQSASLVRDRRTVLHPTTWTVSVGQRWVVLGPNGAGKSTLLRFAAGYELPSSGAVEVLGRRLGRVDVRDLRKRIGVTASWLERMIDQRLTVAQTVASGLTATLAKVNSPADDPAGNDVARVTEVLDHLGLTALADRPLKVLSEGERRRVQLGRAIVAEPDLLVLDEPTAGLDLAGRELLLRDLSRLAKMEDDPQGIVLVTHHLEEIPPHFTHAVVLAAGRIIAAGPIGDVVTEPILSEVFGVPVKLHTADGRWFATARRG